jgi:hypothetical protein
MSAPIRFESKILHQAAHAVQQQCTTQERSQIFLKKFPRRAVLGLGDPALADVVVFAVGKTVLVACTHGKGEAAPRHRPTVLAILKTAKPGKVAVR